MMKQGLFFILILVFFVTSCQEDNEEILSGSWSVCWMSDEGTLHGSIHFAGNQATLKAFGKPGSPFLSDYQEKDFRWHLSHGRLKLRPLDGGVDLTYTLRHRGERHLEFNHLGDITVILQRR